MADIERAHFGEFETNIGFIHGFTEMRVDLSIGIKRTMGKDECARIIGFVDECMRAYLAHEIKDQATIEPRPLHNDGYARSGRASFTIQLTMHRVLTSFLRDSNGVPSISAARSPGISAASFPDIREQAEHFLQQAIAKENGMLLTSLRVHRDSDKTSKGEFVYVVKVFMNWDPEEPKAHHYSGLLFNAARSALANMHGHVAIHGPSTYLTGYGAMQFGLWMPGYSVNADDLDDLNAGATRVREILDSIVDEIRSGRDFDALGFGESAEDSVYVPADFVLAGDDVDSLLIAIREWLLSSVMETYERDVAELREQVIRDYEAAVGTFTSTLCQGDADMRTDKANEFERRLLAMPPVFDD